MAEQNANIPMERPSENPVDNIMPEVPKAEPMAPSTSEAQEETKEVTDFKNRVKKKQDQIKKNFGRQPSFTEAQHLVIEDIKTDKERQKTKEAERLAMKGEVKAREDAEAQERFKKYNEGKQYALENNIPFQADKEFEAMMAQKEQAENIQEQQALEAQKKKIEEEERMAELQRQQEVEQEQQAIRKIENQEEARLSNNAERQIEKQQQDQRLKKQVDDEVERFDKEVASKPTTFGEYWESLSTGRKILTGIGMFLGAFARAGQNGAMKVINQQLENNLKEKMQKEKMSIEEAEKQKLYDLKVFEAQTRRMQANLKNEEQKRKMAELQMRTNQEIENQKQKIILAQKIKEGKLSSQDIFNLPREERDRIVRMPDGSVQIADNKQRATEVAKFVNETQPAVDEINKMMSEIESGEHSRLSYSDRAEMASRRRALAGSLRVAIVGPGAMTEAEYDRLMDIIGDPNAFVMRGAEKRKLNALKTNLRNKVNQNYKSAGIKPPIMMNGKMIKGTSADAINNANIKMLMKNNKGLKKESAISELKRKGIWAE